MNRKNTESKEGGAVSSLSSSDLLDELGLDKLLEYVKNPRQYVRKSMMVNNPSDDDLEDYKAWAQSRARYILEKLYSSNTKD